jgi:glycosyltransferase involved in cell wall biosynthesis
VSASGASLFTVCLATRNRPTLFAAALRSVLDQSFTEIEVIVVDDGSSEADLPRYDEVLQSVPGFVRRIALRRTPRGHGPSYALNAAAAEARGTYLCFLDDDDVWTDAGHLARAARVLRGADPPADLLLCNQRAFRDGTMVDRTVWIEDLEPRLRRAAASDGSYSVSVAELLLCQSFCHLNTTIIARPLFEAIGGMDESLRYEGDREFYLRAISAAQLIRFLPDVVARHNIPDPRTKASASTSETELSRRLSQLRVFDKTALSASRAEVRRYALTQRAYTLAHIAELAAQTGMRESAALYRREAQFARLMLAARRLGAGGA